MTKEVAITDTPVREVTIELRYLFKDFEKHAIKFETRDACARAQVEIIKYIVKTLYPTQPFEILALPSEEGSFRDVTVIRWLNDNPGVIAASGIVPSIIAMVLYGSQLRLNNTSADLNVVEIAEKCKELGIEENSEFSNKVKNVCESYYPKQQKNEFYETIISDQEIVAINPTITDEEQLVFKEEIPREDFGNYIEDIPQDKEYLAENLVGHIQLSQPFIDKQQQRGRGVPWQGIYYGSDVYGQNDDLIVRDGEIILFYMQDSEYKEQILNKEISFTSGDNIQVEFDIGRYYSYVKGKYGKPKVYVKKVLSHNDNLVQHKEDLQKKIQVEKFNEQNANQSSIFDQINE